MVPSIYSKWELMRQIGREWERGSQTDIKHPKVRDFRVSMKK